jgi:hypothetical protein
VVVVPIVAVHGAQVPWGKVVTHGVPVVAAKRLPSMLRQLPAVLGPERVAWLADQARIRFHAAAMDHQAAAKWTAARPACACQRGKWSSRASLTLRFSS